jgi:hypothetical protein
MKLSSTTAVTATGLIGISSALLAAATLWIVLTDPVTVATAVHEGSLAAILYSLARALGDWLRMVISYL